MKVCRISVVQVQPRQLVLDQADNTAPTREHELDWYRSGTYPSFLPGRSGHEAGVVDLSEGENNMLWYPRITLFREVALVFLS